MFKFVNRSFLMLCGIFASITNAHADKVGVDIQGVDRTQLENIVSFMTYFRDRETPSGRLSILDWNKIPKVELSANQIKRAHHLAVEEIQAALQPYGYYSVTVSESLMPRDDDWLAQYKVTLGKPTRIREANIGIQGEGETNVDLQSIVSQTAIIKDKQLSHIAYEETKSALLNTAYESGYLDAKYIRSEIRVEPDAYSADIELQLDTGPLYYFGEVQFQQDILESTIIERFLPFQSGEVFDATKLSSLQLSLEDTDYFSEIEIQVKRDRSKDQMIPIVIIATAAKPRSYSIGAGYGTDTGPRVNLGLVHRRVNKLGHQFRADLRVSEISASVQTQYQIPINQGTKEHIAVTASASNEEIAETDTDAVLVSIGRFESWRGFQRQLYLNYEREKFTVSNQRESIELLIPGISLSKKVSNNLIYPRQGYSFELDFHGASESLASDTDFLQLSASGNSVFPLGTKGRLLLRGETGVTDADQFDLLPLSQRFFNGGDRSVRGYRYQNISPVNAVGERIGGRYLTTLSVEADYLVVNDYGIAVFIDAGDASDAAFSRLNIGAGIGFRYRSPIGMIRVDFARPIENDDFSEYRIHVSIGADL